MRIGITLALSAALLVGCSAPAARTLSQKVIILGFDGADPDLLNQWIDAGKLPNIARLRQSGTVARLQTTNPPESPVAWASFATGTNPGKHGIFDFLKRDPNTYFPDIGLVTFEKGKFFLGIPVRRPKLTNNRDGKAYWELLDDAAVRTVNLRVPLTFPVEPLRHGRTLAGLGVPDVRRTWGTYFYFATDLTQWDMGDTEFGGKLVRLELNDNRVATVIEGPQDPRKSDYSRLSIPMTLALGDKRDALTISTQGQQQTVGERQWSDWFRLEYSAGPFVTIRGVSRFYVLETYPEIRLYLSPISLDPSDPPIPISSPEDYSARLVEKQGLFKSLGWIHETWGLNEEKIDEDIFLQDLFRNMDALETSLVSELEQNTANVYTAVFTATDAVSHMFYRLMDPQSPRYDAELAARFGDGVLRVYQRMDQIVGKILDRFVDDRTTLLVVSDHGFHPWRGEFNTNTWLVRNGYLALKGADTTADFRKLDHLFSGGSFFPNVDWTRSRAYALGLGQIYVNLKGREKQGIIENGAPYQSLVEEIRTKILEFRDPDTDQPVLQNAYFRDRIYQGRHVPDAGDIQLSFRSGYRTSWQTSLGAVPEHIVVANLKKWSGDHCASDPSDTEGIFVSNRKLSSTASIIDIAPTVLRLMETTIPATIDGKPLGLK